MIFDATFDLDLTLVIKIPSTEFTLDTMINCKQNKQSLTREEKLQKKISLKKCSFVVEAKDEAQFKQKLDKELNSISLNVFNTKTKGHIDGLGTEVEVKYVIKNLNFK